MNYRILGIFISVFVMLFSPALSGLIFDKNEMSTADELDKSKLEAKEVSVYISSSGEKATLDFEEYICGVVMAEVPSDFDEEALKAMAVAVRSYCLRRIENSDKDICHFSADVCDDYTHCLGYISFENAVKRWGLENAEKNYKIIKDAVNDTKGEVLYYKATIADAVFHSNSKDNTESAENVWGFDIPYLVSVPSNEKYSTNYSQYDSEEFSEIIERAGILCDFESDPSTWLGSQKKNVNGRCESVAIGDTVVSGRRIREIFGLKSTCFELDYSDGFFTFTVMGNGHGVGMSQYGSNAMAQEGYDYREILTHYYTGTRLGLY